MLLRRLLIFTGLLALGGCLYNTREHTDRAICDLADHPCDVVPPSFGSPAARWRSSGQGSEDTPGHWPDA